MFAYGTLRPGCGNDVMLGAYDHIGSATVPGLLAYHACGAFPVYLPDWVSGDVHGDVLLADDREVANVMAMEVFAGYDAVWADVTLGDGTTIECLTFPWRRGHHGDVIDNGDWTTTRHAYVPGRRHA